MKKNKIVKIFKVLIVFFCIFIAFGEDVNADVCEFDWIDISEYSDYYYKTPACKYYLWKSGDSTYYDVVKIYARKPEWYENHELDGVISHNPETNDQYKIWPEQADGEFGPGSDVREYQGCSFAGTLTKAVFPYADTKKCPNLYYSLKNNYLTYITFEKKDGYLEAKPGDTSKPKMDDDDDDEDSDIDWCKDSDKQKIWNDFIKYLEKYLQPINDIQVLTPEEVFEKQSDIIGYYEEKLAELEKEYNAVLDQGEKIIQGFVETLDCTPTASILRGIKNRFFRHAEEAYNNIKWKIERYINDAARKQLISEEQKKEYEKKQQETEERVRKKASITRQAVDTYIENFIDSVINEKCSVILSDKLKEKIKTYVNWIRIIVPILLIMLGSVDFAKAVLIQEKSDDTNKAFSTFIKRCIIAVAIFFIPLVISYLLKQVNKVLPKGVRIDTFEDCGIK